MVCFTYTCTVKNQPFMSVKYSRSQMDPMGRTDDRLYLTGLSLTASRIAFGIFITSYGETEFNATGFWLVIGEGGYLGRVGKVESSLI